MWDLGSVRAGVGSAAVRPWCDHIYHRFPLNIRIFLQNVHVGRCGTSVTGHKRNPASGGQAHTGHTHEIDLSLHCNARRKPGATPCPQSFRILLRTPHPDCRSVYCISAGKHIMDGYNKSPSSMYSSCLSCLLRWCWVVRVVLWWLLVGHRGALDAVLSDCAGCSPERRQAVPARCVFLTDSG